jgi:hypothetical protein
MVPEGNAAWTNPCAPFAQLPGSVLAGGAFRAAQELQPVGFYGCRAKLPVEQSEAVTPCTQPTSVGQPTDSPHTA